jgi:Zn-dependent protease
MTKAIPVGTAFGTELRLHWSWLLLPPAVAVYSLATGAWREAVLNLLLLLAVYMCVLVHEGGQVLAVRRFGLGTRDLTLYPFWGVARLTQMSDRPWQETYVAATGPILLALVATLIGAALAFAGTAIELPWGGSEPFAESFFRNLFWATVGLTALHLLPVLPLDGGRVFRAALTIRTSRLRATEAAAALSTLAAGCLLIAAVAWMRSPLVGVVGVLLFLSAQDDLGRTRYFEYLRDGSRNRSHAHRAPAAMVAADHVVTPDCRPGEPHFNGFTWNSRARLWIEWRDGRPVSANALIGDGHR